MAKTKTCERDITMEIKNSYVYKGIRKATIQSMFPWEAIRFCVFLMFAILPLCSLFFAPEPDQVENTVLMAIFITMLFGFLFTIQTLALAKAIGIIRSPEKSTAATQYAKILSFEDLCMYVELQRSQPLSDMSCWGVQALADFIIYEHYGYFAVIPYCAVKSIQQGEIRQKQYGVSSLQDYSVVIQDIYFNSYTIVCESTNKREEMFYNLDEALQKARKRWKQQIENMASSSKECN